jgi:Carboxypeptidase regulatory-like domain
MLGKCYLSRSRSFWVIASMFAIAVCGAVKLTAQTTGSIYGTVTDPSGGVISGASVTVRNSQTKLERTMTTGADGSYSFPLLPVGQYEVVARAPGFGLFEQANLDLQVEAHLRVDIKMELAGKKEQVVVSGQTPSVDLVSATLGKVVEERSIVNLPLNGRNFLQLGVLQAGVTPPIAGITVTAGGTDNLPGGTAFDFSVNGMRITSNDHLVDGVNNTEPLTGSAMIVPSVDAIQEFRILTNDYSAEYGRAGGSIVTVLTKSGTNNFHGSLYDFLRNDVLDARNFFSPSVPPLRQNQFGGTFGGPIVKDRTFFFVSYEGFRQSHGIPTSAPVPTLLERSGNFSQDMVKPIDPTTKQRFPQDTIPPKRIDQVANKLLGLWPQPNLGSNIWTATPVGSNDRNQFEVRLDHALLAGKNNFTGRYLFDDGTRLQPLGQFSSNSAPFVQVPGFPNQDASRFQNLVLADTHSFSQKLLNDIRLSYQRASIASGQSVNPIIDRQSLGFTFPLATSVIVPPAVGVSGVTGLGPAELNKRTYNFYQLVENMSISTGKHNIKFGGEIRHTRLASLFSSLGFGAYTFNGLITGNAFADFLLGKPFLFLQAGGKEDKSLRQTVYYFYGRDDYRVAKNLTLNFGLRYELVPGFTERDNLLLTFVPGQQSVESPFLPVGLVRAGDLGVPRTVFPTGKRNFAPRVGLAWDPIGDGKTSVKAGYGIFYDEASLVQTITVQQPPDFQPIDVLLFPQSFADPFGGNSPFKPPFQPPVPVARGTTATWIAPNLKLPYIQQWNLTVQRQVTPSLALEVAYVGTKGTRLQGNIDLNQPVLGPGITRSNANSFRPFPLLTGTFQVSSIFASSYNGLQATVTRRMSNGLSLQAAYTWSKAIDNGSVPSAFFNIPGQNSGRPQNSRNLAAERGLSAFDLRHRFVTSSLYELPFFTKRSGAASYLLGGWRLSAIVTWQSGRPFTVRDSSDPNFDQQLENDRPNLLRNPNLSRDQQTPQRWFDTTAFQPVTPPGNGNAGRNIVFTDGVVNFDIGVGKDFRLHEQQSLEFRWEVFNLFNRANFGVPVIDIRAPNFGQVLSTATPERQMQAGLKFVF